MSRIRCSLVAIVVAVAAGLAGGMSRASAQVVNDFVADLRSNDVTFEEGAFGLPQQLSQLDGAAARLQRGNAYFKVIVLADEVSDYDTPREFAAAVLGRLGGTGRVLVFDTRNTGIASNAGDSADAIERAEEAAATDASASDRWADGVAAAGDQLGITASGGGGDSGSGSGSGSSSGGGGGGILIVLVVLAVVVVGGFLLYRMVTKGKRRGPQGSTVSLGEGEMKVRQQVDRAGNLVLELADRVEMAGAPPEAKTAFQQGATEFADLQDDLEEADTHEELEAVYPKIVDSVWKLESAKALTEGQPMPAKPDPGPLFPPPPAPPAGAPPAAAPDPLGPVDAPRGYRGSSVSPWLTTAATAALTVLASRAMAPSNRNYRPPASDGFFDGGGGRSRGGGRRSGSSGGGIDLSGGSGGRGVKRRR